MDYFSNLFDKKNMPQLVLAVLFIIYLVMGYKMPGSVASAIDTTGGKIIVVLSALGLFAYSNPILGVLALLVAYQLLRTASVKTGMAGLEKYYPTQEKKWSPFTPIHQFPYTLEQEVVKNMTTQKFNSSYVKSPFKPVLEETYNAAPLTQP
jgi:hypothetical protein